ncbi:MAG: hypothetical protein FWC76_08025, partial [Defluviitaleaceae bacterium]|nr:hypothetical protein [Defluviitaleaceae bacterium]
YNVIYNGMGRDGPARDQNAREKPKTKTKFQNYEGRKWNYKHLEMMEHVKLLEDLGKVEEAVRWRERAEEVRVAWVG